MLVLVCVPAGTFRAGDVPSCHRRVFGTQRTNKVHVHPAVSARPRGRGEVRLPGSWLLLGLRRCVHERGGRVDPPRAALLGSRPGKATADGLFVTPQHPPSCPRPSLGSQEGAAPGKHTQTWLLRVTPRSQASPSALVPQPQSTGRFSMLFHTFEIQCFCHCCVSMVTW